MLRVDNRHFIIRKALIAFLLCGTLLLAMTLSACSGGGNKNAGSPGPKSEVKIPATITFATHSTGSLFNTISVPQANMLSKALGVNVIPEPTAGTEAELDVIAQGQADMGIMKALDAYDAFTGTGSFEKKGKQPILAIVQGEAAYYGLIAKKLPDLKTIDDLRGKKIFGKRIGATAGEQKIIELLLKASGLEPGKDVEILPYESSSKAIGEVIQGKAVAVYGALDAKKMEELERAGGAFVIPVSEKAGKAIATELHGMTRVETEMDLPGVPKGSPVLGSFTMLVARKDFSVDAVYAITKALIENRKQLVTSRALFDVWTLERAVSDPAIPYHPGAIKYFKEAGVWTKDLEKYQNDNLK